MEEIRRLIDEKYRAFFSTESDVGVAKEWFYDFAEFLNRSGLSEEQIKVTVLTMMDDQSLENMRDKDKCQCNFWGDEIGLKSEQAFFEYLLSISSKTTPEYVSEGIRFAKQNVQRDGNFMDSFIKYVVITNFHDLHVDSDVAEINFKEKTGIACKLGEFLLSSLIVKREKNAIMFDRVVTRPNLRGIRLGALVFRKLQGDVARYFPNHNLFTNSLKNGNEGGKRFYKSMGAQILENPLGVESLVYFQASKLQGLSEIPVEPPTLKEKLQEPQQKESFLESGTMADVNQIIQKQQEYADRVKFMKEIKSLIDKKYMNFFGKEKDFRLAKEWFYDFAEFLNRSGLSEEQIKEAVLAMMDDRYLDNMQEWEKTEYHFSSSLCSLKEEKAFFEYLSSISYRMTPEYVLEGIRFAAQNLQERSNFIDSFIKYIAITNFQDIQVNSEIPQMEAYERGKIVCNLGELELAKLVVQELDDVVRFDEVATRHNLEGTRIGTILFRKLQADVAQYFSGKDLLATNVLKTNIMAQEFYKSMGATIVNLGEPKTVGAFFPSEKLQELSEVPIEPPQLEYYTNLPTEDSPARAIREYIGKIIQMQKQYLDSGKDIPENLRIPEQIELSPQNLDYLLESGAVDFIGKGENEDEMQFFWKKTEEYPELEMRIKKTKKGKSVLTYIKSGSMDDKEEFVWDSKEKEGKNGTLIISRKDDALDRLIDMNR